MAESTPVPFVNKGLSIKKDPAQLGPGEYYQLENCTSIQEGALTARTGHQKLTSSSLASACVSLSKLNLGGADSTNPRYLGVGGNIYRTSCSGTVSTSGTAVTWVSGAYFDSTWYGLTITIASVGYTVLYVNSSTSIILTASAGTQSGVAYSMPQYAVSAVYSGLVSGQRWSAQQYNSGTAGTPALFFATKSAALRDNGSYSTLQKWGVDPPPIPVIASVNVPFVQSLAAFYTSGYDYRFVPDASSNSFFNSNGSGEKTVSAISGGNPGYTQFTPTAGSPDFGTSGIYVGMLLNLTDSSSGSLDETILVLAVNQNTFYAITQFAHVAGNVTLGGTQNYISSTLPGSPDSAWNLTFTGLSIDASFNGTSENGYSTDDPFHIGLRTTNTTNITNIEIRIIPNYSTAPPNYATSYYYYDIVPASIMTATPYTVPISQNPNWVELNIPKNSFKTMGNAGSGDYTWKNINQIQIVVTESGAASSDSVGVSNLYFTGGGGLNSSAAGTTLYDWAYCTTPDTPILMDDLTWKNAGLLSSGDKIIGFDEDARLGTDVRCHRRMKRAEIVCNVPEVRECVELQTDIGNPIKVTSDHRFLVWGKHKNSSGRYNQGLVWKSVSDLNIKDQIAHFINPWEEDESKNAGWLAGILDGEGSISAYPISKNGKRVCLSIAQNEGVVLDKIRAELHSRGITSYYERISEQGCHHIAINGVRQVIKLLGEVRPLRLLKRLQEVDWFPGLKTDITYSLATVTSVKKIGNQKICSIQTTSGTIITDGYLSHNCFRDPTSGAIGNPCPLMIPANYPPPITNGMVTLTLTGTAAAATIANGIGEITGPGSIKIYRRGGTFSDGFYRHVGYAANPGSSATVTFVDNASDASLDTADTLQFDNDPPVPSSLPVTLTGNIANFQPSGGGTDYATSSQAIGGSASAVTTNAIVRMILTATPSNYVIADIATPGTIYNITVGSTIQVGFGTTYEESIVTSAGYGTSGSDTTVAWIECYLQYNHNNFANDSSETIEIDAILRGECDLVHQDFDCIFLAGDINNTATLYQSKVGRPEAFPVVNLENNFAQQINVGSPSNPINGITSIGPGELVCLNLNNLFIVQVWAGQMQAPIQAPATRGLYSKWCWCKGDNRIWYLGYDGIYTWAGGESQKVSEQIDYLFKKQTINGIAPVDMTQALKFSFAYAENSLFIVYIDTNAIYHRLRYETIYNRWTIETIYQAATGSSTYNIDSMFTEPDTGNLLVAISNAGASAYLWLCDFYSTTDGWVTLPTDGIEIQYTSWKWWPIANPSADYQVGEVLLELENPVDLVTAQLFFNYSTTAINTITVAGGAVPLRNRYFTSVNSEVGVVQYSIGLKLTGSTGSGGLVNFYTFQWRDFPWTGSPDGLPREFGWLEIDCNTNGASIPMELQLDGTTVYSFQISGTFFNRSSTITLPLGLTGIQYRIVPVTGNSGTIQIYKITPHDYPWNDFKSALPKEYSWLEIQCNTNGLSVPMALQIDGVTVYTFSISGTFFNPTNTITLPLNLNGIQWRVVPNIAGYTGIIQIFSMIPRDFAWSDSGYPGPKTFNWLSIEINTNGATVPFEFQLDGGTQTLAFNLSGTFQNRLNTITVPSNYTGSLWRITPTVVGYTGMLQVFNVVPQFQKLPIPVTHFDALYQIFGSAGFRFIFQMWLDFQCAVPIIVSIYRDGNVLFYQETLPAFTQRDVARFYLPAVNTPTGGTPQFNKSQGYRIEVDSSDGVTPFQIYRDGSRVEIHNLSTEQRSGFEQKIYWELIPLEGI